jgi:glycosyltransferase involved in cell wall biosynthesis
VNIANHLPRDRYRSYLCTTREEGALADAVLPDVKRLSLSRTRRLDWRALQRLGEFLRENRIEIVHAHGTAMFLALLTRHPGVVWHVHFGRYAIEKRPMRTYRLASRCLAGVIAVNEPLAEWSRVKLGMAGDRVWYIPNFVCEPVPVKRLPDLPGTTGSRVVCVANLRREKDHLNLLAAMNVVVRRLPNAHLLLLGHDGDAAYAGQVKQAMSPHVTWLGARADVPAVLKACDVGVLSSAAEGMPLALIEYGMSGLPAVATRVGQCAAVLDDGRAGLLVPPAKPAALAHAIITLLEMPQVCRGEMGERFRQHTNREYGAAKCMQKICNVYDHILQ